MLRSMTARILVIVGIVALCGGSLLATHFETGAPVRLGLDLQGGIHLVLEVDDPDGTYSAQDRAEAIEQSRRVIRNRVDELGVTEPLIQVVGGDRLIVELAGVTDEARARELVGRTAMLEWRLVRPTTAVEAALPRIDRAVVAARSAPPSPRAAHDDGGGDATPAGVGPFVPDRQGVQAPDAERPLSALLLRGADAGEFLVAEEDAATVRHLLALPGVEAALPRGLTLRWSWEPIGVAGRTYRPLYVVDREPFMTGDALDDARAERDPEFNRALVRFELSRAAGRTFSTMTGRHVGERLAILLDGEVVSAPVVETRIGSRGVINLNRASMDEARDLALVLRAGALPAPLRIMEQRSVGPSLGQDSIRQGAVAGIVGLALVVAAMIVYYRLAGVLAVGALAIYVLLLLGGLAGLGASLTLPGIAGIILSIGMAVDANVLIFERIREEAAAGRAPGAAVDAGFRHALSAILDANLTTLITALVLFQVGTGPVQGFAVTLSIGIVASFVTALYVTKTFFLLYLRWRRGEGALSV